MYFKLLGEIIKLEAIKNTDCNTRIFNEYNCGNFDLLIDEQIHCSCEYNKYLFSIVKDKKESLLVKILGAKKLGLWDYNKNKKLDNTLLKIIKEENSERIF
ncbi:MAG: hypothetical protein ACRCW9_05915 [Cetobacterium sp.]